jgi:hypothetical protein
MIAWTWFFPRKVSFFNFSEQSLRLTCWKILLIFGEALNLRCLEQSVLAAHYKTPIYYTQQYILLTSLCMMTNYTYPKQQVDLTLVRHCEYSTARWWRCAKFHFGTISQGTHSRLVFAHNCIRIIRTYHVSCNKTRYKITFVHYLQTIHV